MTEKAKPNNDKCNFLRIVGVPATVRHMSDNQKVTQDRLPSAALVVPKFQ
jgi:hypothetical protein